MPQERQFQPNESTISSGGLGSVFDQEDSGGHATVISGVYSERLPIANSTIGEIRTRFQDRFDIAPGSQAVLDGVEVGDEAIIQVGQVLRFRHTAGEKGSLLNFHSTSKLK